jgi:carboxyl-terminal processing protease
MARLFLSCLLFLAPASAADLPDDEVTRESLRFTRIYGLFEKHAAEPLEPDAAIFDGAIRGMLRTLDPFSAFFDPDQFESLQQFARGRVRGFGSILYVQSGKILVLQTAEGSPSRRAGLGPGDEIVSVNGQRVDRLDLSSLIRLLQQARQQRVRLGVVRPGKILPEDFELNPADVSTPTVDKAFILDPGIAYLHITNFDQKTAHEVARTLTSLGAEKPQGVLLDVRDNSGGVLDSAVELAGLFLPSDLPVLTMQGRATAPRTYRTQAASVHFDLPLIVLVNGNTASAAEVLAAALQEHDRALVVGEPTFGKGVVESVAPLSEKTGLALTSAQYFTPSGRSIQRPLPGTMLESPALEANPGAAASADFHTAAGRPLVAGGGITPDVTLDPRRLNPWLSFLHQRGVFISFASEYLTVHGRVPQTFEPDETTLERFRAYLDRRRILSPDEYWQSSRNFLKLRIRAELLNLVYGLEAGEEAETRGDPQVIAAAALFPKLDALLRPATTENPKRKQRAASQK